MITKYICIYDNIVYLLYHMTDLTLNYPAKKRCYEEVIHINLWKYKHSSHILCSKIT